jgi:hypothetical protein
MPTLDQMIKKNWTIPKKFWMPKMFFMQTKNIHALTKATKSGWLKIFNCQLYGD